MKGIHGFTKAGIILLTLGFCPHTSADVLSLYIEAPSVQSTYVTGATTATFDSATTGTYTSTYTSPIGNYLFTSADKGVIQAADQYGGAGGTQYMVFGAQSGSSGPIEIDLTGSMNYFGIWVSAADANNGISFYNGTTAIAHITTATITTILNGGTGNVTAINGSSYATSGYYGNPNNRSQDASEPFVYLDIIDTTGTFNKIVLDNSNTTGTGFESDNHSIYDGSTPVSPNASSVFIQTVPEPSEYATWALGLLFVFVAMQRMIKARRQAALPA